MDEKLIEQIAGADLQSTMVIDGKNVTITCSTKGLAFILLKKIRNDQTG